MLNPLLTLFPPICPFISLRNFNSRTTKDGKQPVASQHRADSPLLLRPGGGDYFRLLFQLGKALIVRPILDFHYHWIMFARWLDYPTVSLICLVHFTITRANHEFPNHPNCPSYPMNVKLDQNFTQNCPNLLKLHNSTQICPNYKILHKFAQIS